MPRQSLVTPISILLAGLALVAMLQLAPNAASEVARQDYPPEQQTQTAVAQANLDASASAYVPPDDTTETAQSTDTPTGQPTSGGQSATPTRVQSPTVASTLTPTQTQETRTATPRPTPVTSAADITPSPTATNTLSCVPGQPVTITGVGPPRAGFLLFFAGRVVSGGSVGLDGRFAIELLVGDERPGDYAVVVRERGTSRLLHESICSVPSTTPTFVPARQP